MSAGANYLEGDAATRSSTRRRNPMACLICRKRKIKCEFNNGSEVCDHCRSKNTKCTVLSVAQEETLKGWGYTDESLASMSSAELESLLRQLPQPLPNSGELESLQRRLPQQRPSSAELEALQRRLPQQRPSSAELEALQRRLPQQRPSSAELESLQRLPPQLHNSAEHTEPHPTALLLHNNHGPPSSPHHPLPPTGQDRSENSYRTHDPGNRAAPSPYNNSAHNHHTASRTGSTNPATVPINIPHPQVHAHHQTPIYPTYPTYPTYSSPSPNHQVQYQIPATGGASVPHHTMGDHHQVQHPNIPAHRNAVQSQDHANYSGQTIYPFQTPQQPSQGQIKQYQYGSYPATMPGHAHDVSQWRLT